jgi:predicted nucleic acid-binding protein
MIAVDTNILVYAHRAESPMHDRAVAALDRRVATVRNWELARLPDVSLYRGRRNPLAGIRWKSSGRSTVISAGTQAYGW